MQDSVSLGTVGASIGLDLRPLQAGVKEAGKLLSGLAEQMEGLGKIKFADPIEKQLGGIGDMVKIVTGDVGKLGEAFKGIKFNAAPVTDGVREAGTSLNGLKDTLADLRLSFDNPVKFDPLGITDGAKEAQGSLVSLQGSLDSLKFNAAPLTASIGLVTAELKGLVAQADLAKGSLGGLGAGIPIGMPSSPGPSPRRNTGSSAADKIMEQVGNAGTITAAVSGGIVYESVKQAGDWQKILLDMKANAAMSQADFEMAKKTIRSYAANQGADMEDSAKAFRRVFNHDYTGKGAKQIVDAAMESSVATGSSMEDTANLLAQQMYAFKIDPSQSKRTMNLLHTSMQRGNMDMGQFVSSAGYGVNALASFKDTTGKEGGLDIKDAFAALSTLTKLGFDPAQASTQLRSLGIHIVAPSAAQLKIADALKAAGRGDLRKDLTLEALQTKGLHGILDDIGAATAGHPDIALKLMAAQRGGIGAMLLSHNGLGTFHNIYNQLGQAQKGKLDPITPAFNDRLGSWNTQIAEVQNQIRELGQDIGTLLMPELKQWLGWVKEAISAFSKLPKGTQQNVANGILGAGALGTGMMGLSGVARGVKWFKSIGTLGKVGAGAGGAAEVGGMALLGRVGVVGAIVETSLQAKKYLNRDFGAASQTRGLYRHSASLDAGLGRDGDLQRRTVGTIININQALGNIKDGLRRDRATLGGMPRENKPFELLTGPVQNSPRYRDLQARIRKEYADVGALTAARRQHEGVLASLRITGTHASSNRSTFGGSEPWAVASGHEMGARFGIADIGGRASSGHQHNSDHYTGNALDFMVGKDKAKGDALASYAVQHAADEHIKYLIWQQHIFSPARAAEGWRMMPDRGSPTLNHMDHVHVSYLSSASGKGAPHTASPSFPAPSVRADWYKTYESLTNPDAIKAAKLLAKQAKVAAHIDVLDSRAAILAPMSKYDQQRMKAVFAYQDNSKNPKVDSTQAWAAFRAKLKAIDTQEAADLKRHEDQVKKHLDAIKKTFADFVAGLTGMTAAALGKTATATKAPDALALARDAKIKAFRADHTNQLATIAGDVKSGAATPQQGAEAITLAQAVLTDRTRAAWADYNAAVATEATKAAHNVEALQKRIAGVSLKANAHVWREADAEATVYFQGLRERADRVRAQTEMDIDRLKKDGTFEVADPNTRAAMHQANQSGYTRSLGDIDMQESSAAKQRKREESQRKIEDLRAAYDAAQDTYSKDDNKQAFANTLGGLRSQVPEDAGLPGAALGKNLDAELKRLGKDGKSTVGELGKNVADSFGNAFEQAMGHAKKFKSVWKEMMESMKVDAKQILLSFLSKEFKAGILSIFSHKEKGVTPGGGLSTPGGGLSEVLAALGTGKGKTGAALGADPGMTASPMAGGGGLQSLLGGGGGGMGASLAQGGPFLAALMATNYMNKQGAGGGVLGLIFPNIRKWFKKHLAFANGGTVPGTGFTDSVPAMLTPGEHVLTRQQAQGRGQGGDTHINVTHVGDVYGHSGKQSAASDMAWLIKQQLPVATPGV